MCPAKVYFIPLDRDEEKYKCAFSLSAVLDFFPFRLLDAFRDHDLVGIKLHFGSKENKTCIDPTYVASIVQSLKKKRINGFICDTSENFRDRGENAVTHIEAMHSNGFSFEKYHAPVIMLDGINGTYEHKVDSGTGTGEKIILAGEIQNVDGLVVLSHPSPFASCAYEGALYNLGVGLAGKRGKIRHYSKSIPKVHSQQCFTCRKCVRECPVNAIWVNETLKSVEIVSELCINCGRCVDVAPFGGITYPWDATPEDFQKTLVKYAKGVVSSLKGRILFINFLTDFSPLSASEGTRRFSKDIGILISKDPVAIDRATWDLVSAAREGLQNQPGHLHVESVEHIKLAAEMGMGSSEYSLETIAY
jgi:uncharacterized Fe-S center protein